MNEKLHQIYMWTSPVVIIILIILVIYYWKKCGEESLCLCSGPQLYKQCRDKTCYGETNTDPPVQHKGMPYDIEINNGYTNFGNC